MDASAIQAKYTRVVKIAGKWNCYLQIDNQGFCIVDNSTKKEANWYAKMIGIALERLVASVKNTEQQVQPDNSPKMCEECGEYPADLPSKLCCGCDAYKEHLS